MQAGDSVSATLFFRGRAEELAGQLGRYHAVNDAREPVGVDNERQAAIFARSSGTDGELDLMFPPPPNRRSRQPGRRKCSSPRSQLGRRSSRQATPPTTLASTARASAPGPDVAASKGRTTTRLTPNVNSNSVSGPLLPPKEHRTCRRRIGLVVHQRQTQVGVGDLQ